MNIFVVCHNKESYETFVSNNRNVIDVSKVTFILVGSHMEHYEWLPSNSYVSNLCPLNIEQHNKLLTFTAWYSLVKNDIGFIFRKQNFEIHNKVGIFEYDIKFHTDIFGIEFKDLITGFIKRGLPDKMFLDLIPEYKNKFGYNVVNKSNRHTYWCPTTNIVMDKNILVKFVEYYISRIDMVLKMKRCSHIHERAVNMFAFENGIDIGYIPGILTHTQSNSHGL